MESVLEAPEVPQHWASCSLLGSLPGHSQSSGPRYESVGKLGEGGMGVVFRASDHDLTRQVALKTLRPALAGDPKAVESFLREAHVVGKLEHPCIPPIHELGTGEDGNPYLVMRLVRGQTLREIIEVLAKGDLQAHRRFSFAERARMMQQLCDAVQFAFENGVIHRDIKPENIMVGPFGELQLMDWGGSYDKQGSLPLEEDFIGTPGYAAPERFGDSASALLLSSEVWSLGLVMYELFTLRPAFTGGSVGKIIQSVMKGAIAPPESLRSLGQTRCPRQFAEIIARATRLEPKERYASALEMRDAIQLALEDDGPVVCPITGFKKSAGILDRMVDNGGGLFAFLLVLWALLPIFMLCWIVGTR